MSAKREAASLAGRRVAVLGLARSGVAAARALAALGARIRAADRKREPELGADARALRGLGVELALGSSSHAEALQGAELIVVSPGVPWELPELHAARARGVEVIAELELAFRLLRGSVLAVTGTKGKSTTTAALGAMLRAAGGDVRVGGNIGAPLTGLLEGATDETRFVVEVSSFQLEGVRAFHPRLAVFLNLSVDHLDRHPSFAAYARAKARVFENQDERDFAVVNADDARVLELARAGRARRVAWSGLRDPGGDDAAFFAGGVAQARLSGRKEELFPLAAVRLLGPHLASDLLAAGVAARLLGVPCGAIARAVAGFQGAEHVLEPVAEISGVAFFDDSKATNVAAARASLLAMERRVHAIVGGRYKGGDFEELREAARERAARVLAIGEARERIAAALSPVVPVELCASLREAVERAFAGARPGEGVLLAPGCASFDMFPDYAARGNAFKDEVARLARRRDG